MLCKTGSPELVFVEWIRLDSVPRSVVLYQPHALRLSTQRDNKLGVSPAEDVNDFCLGMCLQMFGRCNS